MKKILLVVFFLCSTLLQSIAATFTVTNTNDSGAGSLRQAIADADASAGANVINFNISGTGPFTIAVNSILFINSNLTIDGLSQPGASAGSPNVVVTGASGVPGFVIEGSNSILKGLVINGFAFPVQMVGNNNTLSSCFIGTDVTGTSGVGSGVGVIINRNATGNLIGGDTPNDRNIISGNATGIQVDIGASGNTIKGNYIGTNKAGTSVIPNSGFGIDIQPTANNNNIQDNLISGNGMAGVSITVANGTIIKGNKIGTDAAGTAVLANRAGIIVSGCIGTIIGGTITGEANIISGSLDSGIKLNSASYGATAGSVMTYMGSGTKIRGNNISGNGGLGIDILGVLGVNSNDDKDVDTGPNDLQNYPILTGAYTNLVVGTFNSTPGSTFTLDFYSNTAADPSGHGEGQTYLGSTTVTTNATGNASFSFSGTFTAGTIISATATNTGGSTSEFSITQTVQNAMPVRWLHIAAVLNSNNTVSLNWETADEVQNKGFEVERSTNAKSFERIGFVEGMSESKDLQRYNFIDSQPLKSTSYYRLKQLDNDGNFSYSRIIAIVPDTDKLFLTLYPNPTTDEITVRSDLGIIKEVQIFSTNGTILLSKTAASEAITLSLNNLQSGIYLMNVAIDNYYVTKKIIKQ